MGPTAMLLLDTGEFLFLCFSLVGEPKKWDMFVNHEKIIKHKLCDKGLVFSLLSECCLMNATTCKLVQAEDSEVCAILKFAIEHFYAESEDSSFF